MNLRRSSIAVAAFIAASLPALAFGGRGGETATGSVAQDWNRFTAAKYLDARQAWWMSWPRARRDHETACVSCHTAVPYAMSRVTLRKALGENGPSAPEKEMLSYIARRVTLWNEIEPFYKDQKEWPRNAVESRGTESVLNALILARYDSQQDHVTELTRKAFENMWATQIKTGPDAGSWEWLNFGNAPWESNESHYYGTALAAVAVGMAPESYGMTREGQPGIAAMRSYLVRNYEAQPLANRLVVLWASTKVPGLMTVAERQALLRELWRTQHEDGGWSLSDMGQWAKRKDNSPFEMHSDGYATGLAVFALKQTGVPANRAEMQRAIRWLVANQDTAQGLWPAYSLNKQRDLATDLGRLMSDAATSYAVMALEAVQR
jgi:hypothetical protein